MTYSVTHPGQDPESMQPFEKELAKIEAVRPKPRRELTPGYRVVSTADELHCGHHTYRYAICASANPIVLVSPDGGMLWRNLQAPDQLYDTDPATFNELVAVFQRLVKEVRTLPNPHLT